VNASLARVGQIIFAIPFLIFGAMHFMAAPDLALAGGALLAGSLSQPARRPD